MSPGLIVSFNPVAPLLVLPGIAHSGPGRRGNSMNSAAMRGSGMQQQPTAQRAGRAIGQELTAAADLDQCDGREPHQQDDVGGHERPALAEQAREHQEVRNHDQHELVALVA